LPNEGRVLFNGRDIRTLNSKWYHNQVAIVQQEPILFTDTIKNNITYGLDLTDWSEKEVMERVNEACQKASALEFINDTKLFPDGFETVIGTSGISLSGGQK
jgi:ATP-binding cassette subfamily B (MDR/TAP) protein 1